MFIHSFLTPISIPNLFILMIQPDYFQKCIWWLQFCSTLNMSAKEICFGRRVLPWLDFNITGHMIQFHYFQKDFLENNKTLYRLGPDCMSDTLTLWNHQASGYCILDLISTNCLCPLLWHISRPLWLWHRLKSLSYINAINALQCNASSQTRRQNWQGCQSFISIC